LAPVRQHLVRAVGAALFADALPAVRVAGPGHPAMVDPGGRLGRVGGWPDLVRGPVRDGALGLLTLDQQRDAAGMKSPEGTAATVDVISSRPAAPPGRR